MEELSDNYLMRQVQNGDFNKLGLLYERHHRALFAYFYRCTSDKGKSEDLVHNLFMRLLKYRNGFTGRGQFSYWMFATARNLWIDEYRRKDPIGQGRTLAQIPETEDTAPNAYHHLEQSERHERLRKALDQLTPEKKEAIVLSRFNGLKYAEIAEIAQCTENAIKSRIQRGLIELKDILINSES
ncbi:MAG: RNA polymerase sigma factor [Saprospiraceae bacterium]|nr:RNA polymerase sigma factor [Saprospiraceae bacterium]